MQFTAMTAHLEIDYLLNTCSWKTSISATTVNNGPTCTDRGPSVQVQFPHLKISTLTTAADRIMKILCKLDIQAIQSH